MDLEASVSLYPVRRGLNLILTHLLICELTPFFMSFTHIFNYYILQSMNSLIHLQMHSFTNNMSYMTQTMCG